MESSNKGRTQKAIKNIYYNIANQIIILVLSFVSRSVFIWGFGVQFLGINGLFGDILSLLSMADLGFNTAMTYSYYKPLANKDYNKIAELTTFYKKVYHLIAIFISVIGLCLIPFLPVLINLEKPIEHLNLYYLLSLSNVVVSYLCVYKTTVLMADQKGFVIAKVSMLTNLLKTIIQIVSIILWQNYVVFLLIGTLISVGNNIYASHVASKLYPFINNSQKSISNQEKRDIFNNLGSVFLYKVSSVLLNATDNIIISMVVSTTMVGYYSNYLLLQTKITSIISLIFTSVTSSIGNLIVMENEKKRYEVFNCEQSLSFIICGIVVPCYVLLVNDFINVWLGADFKLDIMVVLAIGLNMYLTCVLQPLWSYREATGLYKRTKWVMVVCAILNIILSVSLGYRFGLFGIIFASAISRIMTYVWIEPYILFKEYFSKSAFKYYLNLLLNIMVIIGTVVVVYYLSSFIAVKSFISWIFKAVIVGVISMFIVFVVYHKTEGVQLLRNKIKGVLYL